MGGRGARKIRQRSVIENGADVRIMVGDVFEQLALLEDESVDCVVTSPPYWGLRDYGVDGQIGLERTLGEHLDVMVRVFREVRRVLKSEGTLWLNYGDCYAASPNGRSAADTKAAGNDDRTFRDKPFSTVGPVYEPHYAKTVRGEFEGTEWNASGVGPKRIEHSGRVVAGGFLKPKDLCLIPHRLAIALQDDGWWVRSDIVWAKPNPMPESIRDRPAKAHEYIFLLAKSERYFYDADAIRENRASDEDAVGFRGGSYVEGEPGPRKETGNKRIKIPGGWDTGAGAHGTINRQGRTAAQYRDVGVGANARPSKGCPNDTARDGRNARSVWTIATEAFPEAHFATFPTALAERCILAGCPMGGLVLDPFGGSGTVGVVAAATNRRATLIELNPDYAAIASRRLKAGLVRVEGGESRRGLDALPLFGSEP